MWYTPMSSAEAADLAPALAAAPAPAGGGDAGYGGGAAVAVAGASSSVAANHAQERHELTRREKVRTLFEHIIDETCRSMEEQVRAAGLDANVVIAEVKKVRRYPSHALAPAALPRPSSPLYAWLVVRQVSLSHTHALARSRSDGSRSSSKRGRSDFMASQGFRLAPPGLGCASYPPNMSHRRPEPSRQSGGPSGGITYLTRSRVRRPRLATPT